MTTVKPTPKRQWVGVGYVAEATGFSRYKCYELARQGIIPSFRPNPNSRTIRFDPAAIDKWMQSRTQAAS